MNLSNFNQLFFISDAHLGIHPAEREIYKIDRIAAFGRQTARPGNHLFILGDFFDFWYEWRTVIPKRHFKALCLLSGWIANGLHIYYLAGNHDFRLGSFLRDEIGIDTYPDTLEFTADDKRFHLFHGDGLNKKDYGYLFLKKLLRSKFNQKLFLLIHPDIGMKIADWSSSTSRDIQSDREDTSSRNDYRRYAGVKINSGCDYVLMAHTHQPYIENIDNGLLINTGNWYKDFTYGRYSSGELTLEKFV